MQIKAILFDLDGVLIQSAEAHYLSLNKALKELASCQISYIDHLIHYNGLPTKIKLLMLVQSGSITAEQMEDIHNRKRFYMGDYLEQFLKYDPIKVKLHRNLKTHDIKIGCVTNTTERNMLIALETTGQLPFFDLLLPYEYLFRPKPAAEGYVKAMKDLRVDGREVLIVEDTPVGMSAARDSVQAHPVLVNSSEEATWQRISAEIEEVNHKIENWRA